MEIKVTQEILEKAKSRFENCVKSALKSKEFEEINSFSDKKLKEGYNSWLWTHENCAVGSRDNIALALHEHAMIKRGFLNGK